MTEEIKILLDILNKVKDYDDKEYYISCCENDYLLTNDEIKLLLNYITNLQKELEKKDVYIKYLEEYNPKYYKGKIFYGDGREDYKSRNEKAVEYNYKLQEKTSHQALFDEPLASEIYSIAENNINILEGGDE